MELVDRLVDELPIEKQKDIIATLATLRPSDRRVFVGTLLEHVPDVGVRLKAFAILRTGATEKRRPLYGAATRSRTAACPARSARFLTTACP